MKRILVILAMLLSMNTNAQWVQMSNGIGNNRSITSFAVIGNNIFAGTYTSGIFKSTNNGESWTHTSLNNHSVTSFLINGIDFFAGADNGVYHSTNNGETWVLTSYNNCDVSSLAIHDSIIFAGVPHYSTFGSFGLITSSNNGNTWNATSLNKAVTALTLSGNNIFAGTVYNGIIVSSNNGISWIQTSVGGAVVQTLSAVNNRIVAGTDDGVFISNDYGASWANIGFQSSFAVHSAIFCGINIIVGVNYMSSNAGIHVTSNNGINWVTKNDGFDSIPSGFALLIKDNYIFVGTDYHSVWRRPLSELIGIQNISTETPSAYSLSQNYPNPFNPTTNIKFSIVNVGDVKLVVYDIQGREVQTLVNESLKPGTYEAAFDGSALNSGVYFYKLIIRHGGSSTSTFTETKKMLLIK